MVAQQVLAGAFESDVIGETMNDGIRAAEDGSIDDDAVNSDCCAAANDGRLRRAMRLRERAVVDAMVLYRKVDWRGVCLVGNEMK